MNRVVAELTLRSLLGRRRAVLLALLPGLLLAMAVSVRLLAGSDDRLAVHLLGPLAAGTLIPLLALITGTGAIGPEIDDGSVVYLLAKPVNRYVVVVTKFAAATGVVAVLGAAPILLVGLLLTGRIGDLAVGFAAGALLAGTTYCALFLLLAVVTRHAVLIGLLYALVWETVVARFVPGAQTLSVQQWSTAFTERVLGTRAADLGVEAAVGPTTGVVFLVVTTVAAVGLAGWRLRSLRLAGDE
jgi:ABC-2 type transport system permease protein